MRDSIFHTSVEMPPKNNSPDVVRVAQTRVEARDNLTPTVIPDRDASVHNLEPRMRGCHY